MPKVDIDIVPFHANCWSNVGARSTRGEVSVSQVLKLLRHQVQQVAHGYGLLAPIPVEKSDSLTHEGDRAAVVTEVDVEVGAFYANAWNYVAAIRAPIVEASQNEGLPSQPTVVPSTRTIITSKPLNS